MLHLFWVSGKKLKCSIYSDISSHMLHGFCSKQLCTRAKNIDRLLKQISIFRFKSWGNCQLTSRQSDAWLWNNSFLQFLTDNLKTCIAQEAERGKRNYSTCFVSHRYYLALNLQPLPWKDMQIKHNTLKIKFRNALNEVIPKFCSKMVILFVKFQSWVCHQNSLMFWYLCAEVIPELMLGVIHITRWQWWTSCRVTDNEKAITCLTGSRHRPIGLRWHWVSARTGQCYPEVGSTLGWC